MSDNGTGLATLYNGNTGVKQGLVVTIPPANSGTPTGQVFNSTTSDFKIGATKASFIFATEDGRITAWNGAQGTTAATQATTIDAVYKGLALGNNGPANFLYAANFHSGQIDVFDASYAPATLAGGFTDPNLPAGYAPFNIENIGGSLYVTYAVQNGADDLPGAGHGIVDVFDTNGNFQQRLITGGLLNSPWGLALAPGDFGDFSGDLLVGNFGDGTINAYNSANGAFIGTLLGEDGNPVVNDGLWGLAFGNGGSGGPANALFFTAGLNDEADGLFGTLTVGTPEPGTIGLVGFGVAALCMTRLRKRRSGE